MLQERGPRQKTRLMTDIITFGVGNSTILNQDGKMKILSHVACFYSKCLAKMKNERPAWQCFLTKRCQCKVSTFYTIIVGWGFCDNWNTQGQGEHHIHVSARRKAEADKTYQDLNYLGYHKNCSIVHCFEKNNKHSVARNRITVLNTCLASFSFTLLLSNIDCSSSSSSYKQG